MPGEFADRFGVGGIGVKHGFEAVQQRKPERVGEAEGVKERQDAEHAVGVIDRIDLRGGVDVRDQVPMRKHHAFGRAGAAAGENDRGKIVRLALRPPGGEWGAIARPPSSGLWTRG